MKLRVAQQRQRLGLYAGYDGLILCLVTDHIIEKDPELHTPPLLPIKVHMK
jgi:hypothetical protein